MAKRFRTKKKIQIDYLIKYIVIIIITYLTIKLCLYLLINSHIINFIYSENKVYDYISYLSQNTINEPTNLLDLKYVNNIVQKDEVIVPITKPLVYIYNSHQTEEYIKDVDTRDYKAGVFYASHILKEELEKYNIDVIVEEGNITDFLVTNNMDYSYSYVASRYFLEDAMNKNNISLAIDLHRDATRKENSTININGVDYAKIMFVVGKDYQTYEANNKISNDINNMIKEKYNDLSRGVILKGGKGSNGVYNQDLGTNIILMEIGCQESNMSEVINTISIIAPIIGDYLNGKAL